MMEIRQLRYFMMIADAGSFVRAAQELRVAQPALSRSIAKLEDELQQELLVRHSAGVSMTDAGRLFYSHAGRIMTNIREMQEGMNAEDGIPRGLVKLGAPQSIQAQLVLPVAANFLQNFDLCRLDIIQNSGAQLRDQVCDGSLDLAIVPQWTESRMHVTPLLKESICLICRTDERAKFGSSIEIEELLDLPLILTGYPDSLRLFIERRFPHRADSLKVRSEVNSSASLLELVNNRIGLGLAPSCVIAQNRENLSFVPVEGLDVGWAIVTNWDRRGVSGVRKLASYIIDFVKDQISSGDWPTAIFPDADQISNSSSA